eukprot:7652983-Alexandrium_andersonii.AAC.1
MYKVVLDSARAASSVVYAERGSNSLAVPEPVRMARERALEHRRVVRERSLLSGRVNVARDPAALLGRSFTVWRAQARLDKAQRE